MESYTFEETSACLQAYDQWRRVVTEGEGRELYEGPDESSARPLSAPSPMENLKAHVPDHFTLNQIYDAYRIGSALGNLVRRGNQLFSKGNGETTLRREPRLESAFQRLTSRSRR